MRGNAQVILVLDEWEGEEHAAFCLRVLHPISTYVGGMHPINS